MQSTVVRSVVERIKALPAMSCDAVRHEVRLPFLRCSHRCAASGGTVLLRYHQRTLQWHCTSHVLPPISFTVMFIGCHHIRLHAALGSISCITATLLKSESLVDPSLFLLHHICGNGHGAFCGVQLIYLLESARVLFRKKWPESHLCIQIECETKTTFAVLVGTSDWLGAVSAQSQEGE